MNRLYFILVLALFCPSANAQKLVFSYDASGNQSERKWICINCPTNMQMNLVKKMANDPNIELSKDGLITDRGINAYPNPLKENLNLSWVTPEKVSLQSIDVYSVGGNIVYRKKYALTERTAQINFNHLPPGTYILVAKYSDSKSETIKLIKM